MSDPHHDRPFPRGALIGAALLLGSAILLAGAARITGVGTLAKPTSTAIDTREAEGAEGPVAILAPGTNGFVRSVLRGLARERRLQGVGSAPAFRLTRWADGRLSLDDPSTGRIVELGAFGPTNRAAFAQLMDPRRMEPESALP